MRTESDWSSRHASGISPDFTRRAPAICGLSAISTDPVDSLFTAHATPIDVSEGAYSTGSPAAKGTSSAMRDRLSAAVAPVPAAANAAAVRKNPFV